MPRAKPNELKNSDSNMMRRSLGSTNGPQLSSVPYQERVPAAPRGTAGRAPADARQELSEDVTNLKQAVADLRTTTPQNWWQRHEQALEQTADDVESDVKRMIGNRALAAPSVRIRRRPSKAPAPRRSPRPAIGS